MKYKKGDKVKLNAFFFNFLTDKCGIILRGYKDGRGTIYLIKFESRIWEYNETNIELVSSKQSNLPNWF